MMKILSTHDHEAEDKNKTCGLQHAWKTYTSNNKDRDFEPIPSIAIDSAGTEGEGNSSESLELMDQGILDLGHIPESESSNDTNLLSVQRGCESETESIVSDYSEMADPVKEHLANVQILADPLSFASFIVQPKLIRGTEESEAAFLQRIRKMNFLSLAQEFADLKKQNASILPFNLHEERYKNGKESEEDEADKVDELSTGSLSVDGSEGKKDSEWHGGEAGDLLNSLARMTVLANSNLSQCSRSHVATLEECRTSDDDVSPGFCDPPDPRSGFCLDNSSNLSAEKSDSEEEMFAFCVHRGTSPPGGRTPQCSACGGRDDVRRKLAMTGDDEFLIDGEGECDLELCYVNEAAEDLDLDLCGMCSDGVQPDDLSSAYDLQVDDRGREDIEEDILSRQAFFEMKTRLALAQVRPLVDQQPKTEVQSVKSTVLNLEKLPGLATDRLRLQNQQKLEKMTVTELQIIANNLCERVEALNHQLVADLLQRDDLHMVQDSMLVEIEDLTGRAKEYAYKVDGRRQNKQCIHFE